MQKRLREYVHRSNYLQHEKGYRALLDDFSPVLQVSQRSLRPRLADVTT